MRYWLTRFSFSFIAVGLVLAWSAYHGPEQGSGPARIDLMWVGAAICLAAGLAGVRERHRR